MSREMGYYELKLMMMNESKKINEGTLADVEYALEDLLHALGNNPDAVMDALSDSYGEGSQPQHDLAMMRQNTGAKPGAVLYSFIEKRLDHYKEKDGPGHAARSERYAYSMVSDELGDVLKDIHGAAPTHYQVYTAESMTRGLPKLRGKQYRKITGAELRNMISEDCAAAKKLGRFEDLEDTNISPDEAFQAGKTVAHEETAPPAGLDPTLPQGVITKVEDVGPDLDGDGMGPDEPGRKLGNGGTSRMTREQLHHIAEYAVELWNLLDDEDEIPEWCQSKIAVMGDAISKVKHHLEYKVEKPKGLALKSDDHE